MRKVSLKKSAAIILSIACVAGSLIGCGGSSNSGSSASSNSSAASGQSALKKITVVSREDGSGTRGAFIELFISVVLTAALINTILGFALFKIVVIQFLVQLYYKGI